MSENEKLFIDFRMELSGIIEKGPVEIEFSALELWIILSQMQLAIRHPDNNGSGRDIAVKIAKRIQGKIASNGALGEVAKRGWDPNYDTEAESEEK